MRATRALVRRLTANFADGLTESGLGPPEIARAGRQHEAYCEALAACWLAVSEIASDARFPDGVFVEDAAVVTSKGAILARPWAPGRRGEVASVREALSAAMPLAGEIDSPGTLDGGDVCETGDRFFIGVTARTNPAGAEQMARLLLRLGFQATLVDLRGEPGLLHLKTGLAAIGDGRLVAVGALAERSELDGYEIVRVRPAEAYGANSIRVNDRILVPTTSPGLASALEGLGYEVVTLEMSEFRKMDGGLSCLSLRW